MLPELSTVVAAADALVGADVVPAQGTTEMPPAAAALLDFVRSVNGGKAGGVELQVDDPTRLTVTVGLTD